MTNEKFVSNVTPRIPIPELAGHGLPLSKCEAYNRVFEQPTNTWFSGTGAAPDQRADVLHRIIGVAVLRRLAARVLDLKNTDFGEVAKGSALGPCSRYGQVERRRLLAKLRPGDYRIV